MLMSFVSRSYHTPHFLKEREIWVSHGMFLLGMVKGERGGRGEEREREREGEREKSHAGHAIQTRIGIVMPGMKMDEMSCKKRTKE